jgi:hypothetical protein
MLSPRAVSGISIAVKMVFRGSMLKQRCARKLGRVRRRLGLKRKDEIRCAGDAKLRQCESTPQNFDHQRIVHLREASGHKAVSRGCPA